MYEILYEDNSYDTLEPANLKIKMRWSLECPTIRNP